MRKRNVSTNKRTFGSPGSARARDLSLWGFQGEWWGMVQRNRGQCRLRTRRSYRFSALHYPPLWIKQYHGTIRFLTDIIQLARKPWSIHPERLLNFAGFAVQFEQHMQQTLFCRMPDKEIMWSNIKSHLESSSCLPTFSWYRYDTAYGRYRNLIIRKCEEHCFL